MNYCNGHGLCSADSKCNCFEGWGADSDLTNYRAPDCSAKVCPSGTSWGDLALPTGEAHQPAECSDKGVCNRQTGKCQCSAGYEGAACQRLKCPNNCSGHGRCVIMERLATRTDAFPLSTPTTYQSSNVIASSLSAKLNINYTLSKPWYHIKLCIFYFYLLQLTYQSSQAWDSLKIVGCLCESSWPVGFGANETQEAEWFGPDCSLSKFPYLFPFSYLLSVLVYVCRTVLLSIKNIFSISHNSWYDVHT